MATIGLISCAARKNEGTHKASELYASDLFRKAFTYCTKHYDTVFILSAKYGLLAPDDMIRSYNITLKTFTKEQRHLWALGVASALRKRIKATDTIYFHCGKAYCTPLDRMIPNVHIKPLEGISIGKQLQWYKEQNA
jgi:hypothetical protein